MQTRKTIRRSRTASALATVLIGGGLFFGCSLTGVTDINVGECTSDESCRLAFNEKNGDYLECASYRCVSNGDYKQCEKLDEERDGFDNDCDYLVDENSSEGAPLIEVKTEEFASGIANVESITVAASKEFSQIYVQHSDGTATAIDAESGGSVAAKMRAQLTDPDPELRTAPNLEIELEDGCFSATSTRAQECDINQGVTAAGSTLGYFAQVKSLGCAEGELRVGAIDPDHPAEWIDRGPGSRNPSYRGVATRGSSCSDNGRPACSNAKDEYNALVESGAPTDQRDAARDIVTSECGVSHPAIAALKKQALVAFLGAPMRDEICGGAAVDVFGLLLHERIKTYGDEFVWADPSQDGVPEKLGITKAGTAPAVIPAGALGFLLAHSDEDGSVRMVWIPEQPAPPSNSGIECPDKPDCDSREGLETAALSDVEEFTILDHPGSGIADGIQLTWLTMDEDSKEVSLAVTWVDGCAEEDGDLGNLTAYVQVLRLAIPESGVPTIEAMGPVVNLGPTRAFPLAVVSDMDFFVPGFERDGATVQENETTGFFVLTRPTAIVARRIAAFDGAEVVEGETIPVGESNLRYVVDFGENAPEEFLLNKFGDGILLKGSFGLEN